MQILQFLGPLHAFISMSVISGKTPLLLTFFLLIALCAQSLFIFFMHFMAIKFSNQIHQCSKHLIKFNVLQLKNVGFQNSENVKEKKRQIQTGSMKRMYMNNLKMQLKLDNYIAKFHVPPSRRYGITLKKYSNVTFRSFGKVSFVLIETVLMCQTINFSILVYFLFC